VITWSSRSWGWTTAWNRSEGSFLDRTVGTVRRAEEAKADATESADSGARLPAFGRNHSCARSRHLRSRSTPCIAE